MNIGMWAWSSGETGSLCYWNFCGKNEKLITEDYLCEYERRVEMSEYMNDWYEYIGEFDG